MAFAPQGVNVDAVVVQAEVPGCGMYLLSVTVSVDVGGWRRPLHVRWQVVDGVVS